MPELEQVTEVDTASRTKTQWDGCDGCWRIVLIRTSHVASALVVCCQSMSKEYLISAVLF